MDETSVRFHQDVGHGLIVEPARIMKRQPRSLVRNISKAQARGACTHVTLLSDSVDMQKLLPQFILYKDGQLNLAQLHTLTAELPKNIHILKTTSAWMTAEVMQRLLKEISKVLMPFAATHEIFITADVYKAHITKKVWAYAGLKDIWYCTIPGHLTWVLQPCDTHLFSQYKAELAQYCHQAVLDSPEGKITVPMVLQGVAFVIRNLIEGQCWRKAFADTGLLGDQTLVSDRVLGKLGFAHRPPSIGSDIPCLQDLKSVFPKKYFIPINEVFSCVTRRVRHQLRVREHQPVAKLVRLQPSASSLPSGSRGITASPAVEPCPPTPPPLPPPPLPPPRLPSRRRLPPDPAMVRRRSSQQLLPVPEECPAAPARSSSTPSPGSVPTSSASSRSGPPSARL